MATATLFGMLIARYLCNNVYDLWLQVLRYRTSVHVLHGIAEFHLPGYRR